MKVLEANEALYLMFFFSFLSFSCKYYHLITFVHVLGLLLRF